MNICDPYEEEVQLSPNRSGKISPKFIVLHHTSGNFSGSLSWVLQSRSRVSYHYLINPANGNRVQCVWDSRRAWHAGKSRWKGYRGLNGHSVSIAFDRDTNERTPSPAEIDSVAHKCVYLMEKFNLGLDSIITHAMISPGRKFDCSGEAWNLVIEKTKELVENGNV